MKECKKRECAPAPAREEVKAYAKAQQLTLDCDKFFDHYAAVGWVVNGSPITDWKAKAREWSAKDKAAAPETSFDTGKYSEYVNRLELKYG